MSFVKRLVPGLVHGKWVELGFLASIPGNTTWYDVIFIKGEQTDARTTRQQESQSQPTPKQLKSRWIPFKDSGTYAFSIWKRKQVQSIRLCVASMQSDLQSCSFIKLQVIIYMLFIDILHQSIGCLSHCFLFSYISAGAVQDFFHQLQLWCMRCLNRSTE